MKKKILFSILAIALAGLGLFIPAENVNAESINTSVDKTYVYEIDYSSGYVAESMYSNNTKYSFTASRVEDLIGQIDSDRLSQGGYNSCTLVFNNVTIGNDFIPLENGQYTIKGTVTANALNTKGVFSLDGADVTFEDVTLTNMGFSPLIKNTGAGNMEIKNGVLTADSNVILSTSASSGSINILGGTLSSQTGYAVQINSSNIVDLNISNTQTRLSSAQEATIKADKANININGGEIINTNPNGACIKGGEDTNISISGNVRFGGFNHINTQNSVDVTGFTGDSIKVLFDREILNGETALYGVLAGDEDKYTLQNDGYRFKVVGDTLTLNKILKVNYFADDIELTENMIEDMQNEYFKGDNLVIHFFDSNIKDGYVFTGYAFAPNEQVAINSACIYTFDEEDLNLYAVFVPKEYNITYELGGLDVDNSVNASGHTYTVGTELEIFAPSRMYYDFIGWYVDGGRELYETYAISAGQFGDVTLTAVWELHKYEINYIGIDNLNTSGLKTEFTIEDEPLTIEYSKFLGKGYSLYSLALDEGFLNILDDNEKIYFDTISRPNPETINIYIKAVKFQNGGNGTENSPYIIYNEQQFMALLEGQKSDNVQHIKLNADINILEVANTEKPLKNIIFDGNNKTISFKYLNKINNFVGLFPSVENCRFENINFTINNFYDAVFFEETKYIGFAFGNVNNSILSNISLDFIKKEITIHSESDTGMLYLSTFVARAENSSVLNNITVKGSPILDIYASGDLNLYFGGISGAVYNSLIINSQTNLTPNLNTTLFQNASQAIIFTSGLANLWRDAKVYNCINFGGLASKKLAYSRVISSELANAFAEGVSVKNCYSVYANKLQSNPAITKNSGVWTSQNSNLTSENVLCFAKGENDLKNGNFVKTFNKKNKQFERELANSGFEYKLNTFYHSSENPGFKQSILVHYKGLGVIENKDVLYENRTDLSYAYVPYTGEHFFNGWYLNKNLSKKADLKNLENVAEITLYAKFTSAVSVANGYFAVYIVIDLLLLAGLFVGLYFFDKRKPVKFYSNGKLIAEKQYRRLEEIEFPEGYENTLWFSDIQGLKPFTDRKMSYKPLTLYTFNESKQRRMENKYYEKIRLDNEMREIQEKERLLAEEKMRQEREERRLKNLEIQRKKAEERKAMLEERRKQKQAQAQAKAKERQEAEARRAKAEAERKAAEEKRRAQKEVDIDGKITVIKKEIKVIKPKNEKDE